MSDVTTLTMAFHVFTKNSILNGKMAMLIILLKAMATVGVRYGTTARDPIPG